MQKKPITKEEIKRGIWLYDNQIPATVIIFKTNYKPGSGDYEDPPEIGNDQWGVFYRIDHTSTVNPNVFTGGYGELESLEETITMAEKRFPGIIWGT